MITRGLDQPVQVQATLDNALPLAWDAGGLPLSRLALSASSLPRAPQRGTLERFELRLADGSTAATRQRRRRRRGPGHRQRPVAAG